MSTSVELFTQCLNSKLRDISKKSHKTPSTSLIKFVDCGYTELDSVDSIMMTLV
jgi:hypothetical protein